MKNKLFVLISIVTLKCFGQGFPLGSINWGTPNGGKISGGITFGFNNTAGSSFVSDNTGSQTWSLMDMNGDKRPDLVVCAQLQAGNVTCFSPGTNQYWNVYLNSGNGFSATPISWSLPNGGRLSGGITYGFDNVSGTALSSDNTGSQTWTLLDVTGDSKPELIVTAQLQAGDVTCFSPGSNQYWKVYLNTSSGFSTTPINWSLPNGGKLNGGITYGYNTATGFSSPSDNTGSQNWSVTDINGDGKSDLLVTGQLQAGNVTCFSPGSNQYWKVFVNTSSGFSTTPINWTLPNGGKLTGGITFGYDNMGGSASASDNTGSQTWSVVDLDGDNKPELLVAAQLQAGFVTCFSPGSNQYWKVFSNTGTGFSITPTNWNLPNGGKLSGGTTYGYNSVAGVAFNSDNTGSQTWSLVDLDGDKKSDLVVTAQLQAGNVTCFSPGSSQYWKAFRNNGTGFNITPISCNLPDGGKIAGGTTFGFNNVGGAASPNENTGSQNWSVADLNGDFKPDLIVAGQLQAGNVTSFSPGSSQYWKVYISEVVLAVNKINYDATSFEAFPNPNDGRFTIKSKTKENIIVTNELGQVVKKFELSEKNNFAYEVVDLPYGLYFITGKTVQKVLVRE